MAASTDWLKTAARIVELQAEWKAIGGVPRKHSQVTLCECVERAESEDVPAEVESAKTAWGALPAAELLSVEESSGLARRFDDGCALALRRHEKFSEILDWRRRIETDLELIEAKVAAGALDEVSSTWPSLRKGWPKKGRQI